MGAGDASRFLQQLTMKKTWESSNSPYLFFNEDGVSFTSLGFTTNRGDYQTHCNLTMKSSSNRMVLLYAFRLIIDSNITSCPYPLAWDPTGSVPFTAYWLAYPILSYPFPLFLKLDGAYVCNFWFNIWPYIQVKWISLWGIFQSTSFDIFYRWNRLRAIGSPDIQRALWWPEPQQNADDWKFQQSVKVYFLTHRWYLHT